MRYLQKNLKNKIKILSISILLLFGMGSTVFGWYTYRVSVPNMYVSTGILNIDINPKHLKYYSETDSTLEQSTEISNIGSLPLQYKVWKLNRSHDCQYVYAMVRINENTPYYSNSLLPEELLPHAYLSSTDTLRYTFFKKDTAPERNINCELNIHVIAWQDIFIEPTSGFTDKEILKMNILFKREILEIPEVKSFPTSGEIILPDTLL